MLDAVLMMILVLDAVLMMTLVSTVIHNDSAKKLYYLKTFEFQNGKSSRSIAYFNSCFLVSLRRWHKYLHYDRKIFA